MCTEVCPCYSTENWLKNSMGINMIRNDPQYVYSRLHEDLLNTHNRTNDPLKTEYDLFNFTTDPRVGFNTF